MQRVTRVGRILHFEGSKGGCWQAEFATAELAAEYMADFGHIEHVRVETRQVWGDAKEAAE